MTQQTDRFTDETLTAYLDGELDAATSALVDAALPNDDALTARLAALDFPMAHLRTVMAPEVLGAPRMPADLVTASPLPDHTPANTPHRPRFFMPLALAASFFVGMVVTTLIPAPTDAPEPAAKPGWIASVASYQSLYVTETLTAAPQAPEVTEAVLARAADEFGVTLDPAKEIDGMTFKRAQILGFRGKPLLQMAYLTEDGVPMALCLIQTQNPDRGARAVEMFDLAGVSWVKDGVGYFLIGGGDADRIDTLSAQVIAAL